MDSLETLILSIAMLPVFAAIGITTIAAFALMAVMGLITEWSFRRIFFTSFLLGLIAPIIVGVAVQSAVVDLMDGRDLREVVTQTLPGAEERIREFEEIGPRVREIEQQLESGDISRNEARDRIEQVIEEQTGVEVNLDGVQIEMNDGALQIEND